MVRIRWVSNPTLGGALDHFRKLTFDSVYVLIVLVFVHLILTDLFDSVAIDDQKVDLLVPKTILEL